MFHSASSASNVKIASVVIFTQLLIAAIHVHAFTTNSPPFRLNFRKSTFISASKSKSTPKPISSNDWPDRFPAKEHCSKCGLCETTFVQHVETSCAFLGEGMGRIDSLEQEIHGKSRLSNTSGAEGQDLETRFGVMHEDYPIMLVKGTQQKAQWTGAVTSIAIAMLENNMIDAVVCIASADDSDRDTRSDDSQLAMPTLEPQPIIAKTVDDILRGRGVKPSLAPSLRVLDDIKNDPSIKKLLFCGVGCAVQAFRSSDVQEKLGLERVYVLGTNCADNSPTSNATRDFISSGLNVDERELSSVRGYEFMQDFQVHVKKTIDDVDTYEKIPYFSLPGKIARSSIASSCLSCFDYTNALADVVVGYMGAPLDDNGEMDSALQTLTVRNDSGREMIEAATRSGLLSLHGEALGNGPWQEFAVQTVASDGIVAAMVGKEPKEDGMPRFLGKIMAKIIKEIGPKGLNFASYSIDYHILRNYLYTIDQWGERRAEVSMPQYSKNIVKEYLDKSKSFSALKDSIVKKKS
jgi:coenzyme F420-reducing hydrogenase beta subunit